MFASTALAHRGFGSASRFRSQAGSTGAMTVAELALLVAAGALAAAAVAFIPLQLRIPGHAILKAALPVVLGVALVPRGFAGTIAGIAAAATSGLFLAAGVGNLQPAAVASLLAIGPAIDLAMTGARSAGPALYLRFAAAGMLANVLAFAVRWGTAAAGFEAARPRVMQQLGVWALLSFAVCGIVAGLISGAICFGRSSDNT
jgi:hypothetical protein